MIHARQLETELAAMTAERDVWKENFIEECSEAATLTVELEDEREKSAKLEDIIRRASTKFCEDGPDGEIAEGMFRILGEKALEETK